MRTRKDVATSREVQKLSPNTNINGGALEQTTNFMYLERTVTDDWKWTLDINRTIGMVK